MVQMRGHPRTMTVIDKIRKILKIANGPGMWIAEIARKAQINHATVLYYIDGKIQNGKKIGGYLNDEVEIVKMIGKSKMVRIKEEAKK